MKKMILPLLVAVVSINSFALDRAHTLKVYNWADYISEEVLEAFPEWYKEQTGEEVELLYQTFDINESMLAQIEKGKEDYDVICPSEYIVERLLKNNLLQPIQKEIIPDSLRYFDNVSPFVEEKFQQMSHHGVQVKDYTVGYMWGTTGFLYNTELVDVDELKSWGAILNPKFEKKIFMKDAFRDTYSVLVLYAYRDDVAAGKVTRAELMQNVTTERLAAVEQVLMEAKNNIVGWEIDFGKEEMTKGKILLNLSWSGDAQWAIEEAAAVGVSLDYIVPEEGSNVWFDGWAIPIYAQNPKAATYFINYMCRTDNALKNMDEIGYVSVIATPEMLETMIDSTFAPINASYFFGEGAEAVCLNPVFYPDQQIIDRCALMKDVGDQTEAMLEMWNRIKGDNLSVGMVWIIVAIIVLVVAFVAFNSINKRKQTQLKRKRKK